MTPIYTLPTVPGATDATKWEAICHSRDPFILIVHERFRHTSRWAIYDRKRPFGVEVYSRNGYGRIRHNNRGYFVTLEAAQTAARKIAKEMDDQKAIDDEAEYRAIRAEDELIQNNT